eukprot:Gregarina_sp_Poly_1__10105@NODE_687_length_6763_cov_81_626045_g518_i0_p2_GENE_NODE_687_length_6763_cov_81_626045_g518_i0NODE_687_length_6763_cov_81_626045_g518_i0_p2_ORF_typecomplete_len1021_score146_27GTP_EFTU/PF00009_27/2_3e48EFG_C/PF00679_24/3_3e11EFG_II/PF14492_6/2_1e06EFG_IV/PF03764_18/3_1e05GTP_EFTU_D2/PF03144_25/0_00062MMR_HSR1/PF01926_23/0_0035FeoB_N/PF02421_18/0_012Ras/PF00071_22/0_025DUF2478/PF10649_9/1_4e02DUF2478/PF10649_9/0_45RsgA_GTPase/PF03193_16/1_4e02RsgA_GTPase/PF03193_16/3_8_N
MSTGSLPAASWLQEALDDVERIRNVCVIAHVDHGKTSLCDHLIASNGHLSARMAGQTRFMDAREDEQTRLITIKSSAIPLLHKCNSRNYVVNLVDSPGHIDFSVEVSAAARLCDGALLVVDVLEGFASQSKMVMRQACKEGVSLLLVLNKMDRLFIEARLAPSEIYLHIRDLLETINATLQKFLQEDTDDIDELDDIFNTRCFSPEKGNVVFVSALHGWAFTMRHFSNLLASKILERSPSSGNLTEMENKLQRTFWGNYAINFKTFQVSTKSTKKNIATSFVFEPIFKIYSLTGEPDIAKASLLVKRLNIDVNESMLQTYLKDAPMLPAAIMSKWLPCSNNTLSAIIECLPNPRDALPSRMMKFGGSNFGTLKEWTDDHPLVLYIAKSLSADTESLRLSGDKLHGREKLGDFVGFGRIFNGRLNVGDDLVVPGGTESATSRSMRVRNIFLPIGMDLLPVSQAASGSIICVSFGSASSDSVFEDSLTHTVRWLLSMKSGIQPHTTQLDGYNPVDRCVTLTDAPQLVRCFDSVYRKHSAGILRIGVGPENLNDWSTFLRGLALLYRADPAVHIDVLDSGEFILCCQGQVHAERVLQDLNFLYCPGVKVTGWMLSSLAILLVVSPPLVAVREGFVKPPTFPTTISQASLAYAFPPWNPQLVPAPDPKHFQIRSEGYIKSNDVELSVRAVPMPVELLSWMDANVDHINTLFHLRQPAPGFLGSRMKSDSHSYNATLSDCKAFVADMVKSVAADKTVVVSNIHSLCVAGDSRTALFLSTSGNLFPSDECSQASEVSSEDHYVSVPLNDSRQVLSAITTGFESASKSGPLCEEPVRGVIFVLSRLAKRVETQTTIVTGTTEVLTEEGATSECGTVTAVSQLSTGTDLHLGSLIGSVRSACRLALESRGCLRIYELYLKLEIQCDETVLGKVHSLLAQKRAQVVSEQLDEKTLDWTFICRIPSTETYDLSAELRRRASGRATFILTVDGWALNSQEPFPECVVSAEVRVQKITNSEIVCCRRRNWKA